MRRVHLRITRNFLPRWAEDNRLVPAKPICPRCHHSTQQINFVVPGLRRHERFRLAPRRLRDSRHVHAEPRRPHFRQHNQRSRNRRGGAQKPGQFGMIGGFSLPNRVHLHKQYCHGVKSRSAPETASAAGLLGRLAKQRGCFPSLPRERQCRRPSHRWYHGRPGR